MVVLATKVYIRGKARSRALSSLSSLIQNAIGGLDVTYDVGVRSDSFPTVTITGTDETVARNLLRTQWGEITDTFEHGMTYVGTLEHWDDEGIVLDAGKDIRIRAENLGLGPGAPPQIIERFGLIQHLPMRFVWMETPTLSNDELDRLFNWRRGPGRVNVNSVTRGEVRATINRSGHARDIITVERLGLLEQSVVCRESTDPPGLLAAIGRFLPAEMRCVIP